MSTPYLAGAGGFTRLVFQQAALAALLSGPQGAVAKHMLQLAQRVERRAKQLAPVDTGRLRASITSGLADTGLSFGLGGHSAESVVALVGTDVDYAPHVEYGTYRMAAQPFLRPALDEVLRT